MSEIYATRLSDPLFARFKSYRNATVEKWGNKVQVASGIPLNKKFKAFDQVSNGPFAALYCAQFINVHYFDLEHYDSSQFYLGR